MNKFKYSFLAIATFFFIMSGCNKEEKTFGIELSQKQAHEFPQATSSGYTVTPLNVTVTNTGNQPTGALAIALSGANADGFVLSTTTLLLDAGKTSTFSVEPKTGLAMGIYNATVTVSGGNGIVAQSFDVRFEINLRGIDLSQKGVYEFPPVTTADYTVTPLSVTVTNIGNQPTGSLTIALSGAGADGFNLSATTIESVSVGQTATFTVAPKTGLLLPEYSATVTVSGGENLTAKSFDVQFAINVFVIELSQTDVYEFPSVTAGDYTVTPLSVTITNTGYLPTGQLTVALSGDNAGDFDLPATAFENVAVENSVTFTVAPKTGLSEGEYAATVTVSGSVNIAAKSFDVLFVVEPPLSPFETIEPYQHTQPASGGAGFYPAVWTYSGDVPYNSLTFHVKLGVSINDLLDEDGNFNQKYFALQYGTGIQISYPTGTAVRRFIVGKWVNSDTWVFSNFASGTSHEDFVFPDQKRFIQQLMNNEAVIVAVYNSNELDFYWDRGDGKFEKFYTWTTPQDIKSLHLCVGASTGSGGSHYNFAVENTRYINGSVYINVADPTVFVELGE